MPLLLVPTSPRSVGADLAPHDPTPRQLNEKRAEAKEEAEPDDTLAEQIKAAKQKWKETKKQTAKGKADAKASQTVEKIEDAIAKLDDRIACVCLPLRVDGFRHASLTPALPPLLPPPLAAPPR